MKNKRQEKWPEVIRKLEDHLKSGQFEPEWIVRNTHTHTKREREREEERERKERKISHQPNNNN